MKKWKCEISVSKTWIDDGFDLTAENLKDAILSHLLGYAYDNEVQVKVFPTKKNLKEKTCNPVKIA